MLKRWHVLLLDAVFLSLIPIAALLTRWMLADLPPCVFLERGIQCPSCGGTRCVQYLTRFQFVEAFKMNPLFFVTAMVCVGLIVLLNISVLLRWQRGWLIFRKICRPYLVSIWAIAYLVFGVLRIIL